MSNRVFGFLAGAALFAGTAAAGVTISVDKVEQRYPWNGIVDIDYTVAYDGGTAPTRDECLEVYAVNNDVSPAVTNRAWSLLQSPLPIEAGKHRIAWDANADGVDYSSASVTICLSIVHYGVEYMVVDISAGAGDDKRYPVTYLDAPPDGGFLTDEYRTTKMVLRRIRPGSYVAGSPSTEYGRVSADEGQHRVVLTNDFYIGIFELTKKQWNVVQDTVPWSDTMPGDGRPAEYLAYERCRGGNWPDQKVPNAASYLHNLNKRCVLAGGETLVKGFDMPTEAQWEFACRAGTTGGFSTTEPYDDTSEADQKRVMASLGLCDSTEHVVVGSYAPNAWGLYDMHGNVYEWCRDTYVADVPGLKQIVEPVGRLAGANQHPARGGGYDSPAKKCRSAYRWGLTNTSDYYQGRSHHLGMRIACVCTADSVRHENSNWRTEWAVGTSTQALDLRKSWPVEQPETVELPYSSLGWGLTDAEPGAVVAMNLAKGDLEGIVFTPDAGQPVTLASGLTGRGTVSWTPEIGTIEKKVYAIRHETTRSGKSVENESFAAYYDMRNCDITTPSEYRAAALAENTEAIDVLRAESNPWMPVGASPRSGLTAGAKRGADETSDVTVVVRGCGTLAFDAALTGGRLTVLVDGVPAEWASGALTLEGMAVHTVVFRHTAAGDGTAATLRNVQWTTVSGPCGLSAATVVPVDLRPGVRSARRLDTLWPIQYSSTNWIGDVTKSAKAVAVVSVVRLTGASADITSWTDEMKGTKETLYQSTGEGQLVWKPKKAGVWKMTFQINNGTTLLHSETSIFDLRTAVTRGFMICVMGPGKAKPEEPVQDIVLNNGASVCVYDGAKGFDEPGALKWRWRPADDQNLPSAYRSMGLSEVKPLNGGKWIGVVGGYNWAIVDTSTHQAVGWGDATGNPHSIELLPNGILAVVSTSNAFAESGANSVHLYDISGDRIRNPSQQNHATFHTASGHTFDAPHGIHWDAATQKLWVGGSDGLNKCTVGYSAGTFTLTVDQNWPTVVGGVTCTEAHDLRPVPGTTKLVMTTIEKVIFFDMKNECWLPDETLGYGLVKCFDPSATGRRFLVQVPNHSWNTDVLWLYTQNEDGTSSMNQSYRTLSGADIYKARWMPVE